jgi:hypothetical protein
MRSRLVTILTAGMLVVGTGSAVAFFDSEGDFSGSSERGSAAHHEYKPPCKEGEEFEHGECVKEKHHGHQWEHRHGWGWHEHGHGRWEWSYGDSWVYD